MERITQLLYDKERDVLYLSVGEPRRAVSQELGDDVLLRVDPDTGSIVGLTIMNLSTRDGAPEHSQPLPIEIEVHRPV